MSETAIRVLLVDDSASDARLTRFALEQAQNPSFLIDAADNLATCLERLRAAAYDVVLLDLGLPESTGLDTLARVRAENAAIPIVVLTGLADEAMALTTLQHGAQDYLLKSELSSALVSRSIRYATIRQQFQERVEQNRRLAESENLQRLLESAADATVIADASGRIVMVNALATRLFGYEHDEMVGQPVEICLPHELRERHVVLRNEFLRNPTPRRSIDRPTLLARRRDGSDVHVEVTLSPLDTTQGLLVMAVIVDVSERRRAEAALKESQQAIAAFVKNLPGMAYRCRNDGQWTVDFVSYGCCGLTGSDPEELMQRRTPLSELIQSDERAEAWDTVRERLAAGEPFQLSYRIGAKGDQQRWVCEKGTCTFDDDGNMVSIEGFVSDVTELKQAEAALRERENQLRQSLKLEAVGSLAGGIAHEFNNLLQVIHGYSQYAMDGLSADDPRHQDLVQVVKAANRAASLTRQLLRFSRQEELQRVHVNPNTLVSDVVQLLRPLLGEHIELEATLGDDVGTLHIDPTLVQQMLINLSVNARDAMEGGGVLHIKTRHVVLDAEYCHSHANVVPGSYLLLSVSDTGCGMTPTTKERIFEPFFTTKEVGKGTGLGLAMVYGVVQQHQGVIHVYSEPGMGTVFNIYLPTCDDAPDPNGERAEQSDNRGSETILVAEDEPMVRNLAVRILTRAGYSVLTAADGEEAVRVFEANSDRIDLALLDVVMPKLNGREVLRAVRALRDDVAVVFCSGYDPNTSCDGFVAKEGLRYVPKPFTANVLLQTIRETLDSPQPKPDEPLCPVS